MAEDRHIENGHIAISQWNVNWLWWNFVC